ncbi:RNA-dependent RNA polymerase, putative [Paecilomyces variotii No. 5]|uniref:RNA-dependent RNA polymerase, putative n=1 Tax=Byssochlamys spectabilis (strain No. 5 / NBRC 109023) TaxID=1356009 RepID=V5HQF9_BYSSN|nr:RNA-dependent RNA polymerase, putative [Paecilomyces variotii No. 5]
MEIFVHNLPHQLHSKHIENEFKPILRQFGIYTFACRAHSRKGHATLTVPDAEKAQAFLNRYTIYVQKSKFPVDKFLVAALQDEERNRQTSAIQRYSTSDQHGAPKKKRSFFIVSLSCGVFDYSREFPVFVEHFSLQQHGSITFGKHMLKTTIQCPPQINPKNTFEAEFDYSTFATPIYLGGSMSPSMTFSCRGAPRLYDKLQNTLVEMVSLMGLSRFPRTKEPQRNRISQLGSQHSIIVSTCFTYRFVLRDASDIQQVRNLSQERHIPRMDRWHDVRVFPDMSQAERLGRFLIVLSTEALPFQIKYQLQMLVWNGVLPIKSVLRLFPFVTNLWSRAGVGIAAKALQELPNNLEYPGPEMESSEFSIDRLIETLSRLESGSYVQVSVTPTGIFFDYFLRIEFMDETGDPIRFDPRSNLDEIYDGRFKSIMRSGISIAGRLFQFLGFSHSSLRAQSCWFVAEFTWESGERLNSRSIIPKLGEFGHIYSPAKYAARIGQTFSDTLTSIPVQKGSVKLIPDVERNGRVFSDGCGTISKGILWKIRRNYALRARVKPTVFQVRFSGAKGMLSLDASIQGDEVRLRQSMIKFQAVHDWNIEICGAGINALPFYLNAQIIKLLEDLGVPLDSFQQLQKEEIERLRSATQSAEQAARFIDSSYISKSTRLPWLIRTIQDLDLDHMNDEFLRRAVEFAIIIKLRDLKYRGRIPVVKAVTLYGIMDETGYLNEGEIFCPVLNERNHREILVHKNVIITRSPALHPGDIQLVNAVDVPLNSPLRQLHNCVIFSQKGQRDLASKLSGGDLDGDLFNIIYDDRLLPRMIAQPANYPRSAEIVLDRPVSSEDVVDFFIDFMKQDQLGRIATVHQILADQKEDGTFDPACILLAQLHSTAVDFSKTGKPVDVQLIPRSPRSRPDFMAPSPRIRVEDSLAILEEEQQYMADSDDEEEQSGIRYYKSQRALGHLYRAVDEREFLQELQSSSKDKTSDLLNQLWEYIKNETAGFIWDHYVAEGRTIKEVYEDNLRDLMHQFSATPWKSSLTELEVFIGTIMGESHRQTKRQKEISKSMREDVRNVTEPRTPNNYFGTFSMDQQVVNEKPMTHKLRKLTNGLRGCMPVHQQKNNLPLGLDQLRRLIKAAEAGREPEEYSDMFVEEGCRTFATTVLGITFIQTVEPKNMQAILTTQFHDFALGRLRRRTFFPLLGNGIFTADGKTWEHSRAMLRPQFVREQVADLALEEKHVSNLMGLLSTGADGWTQEIDMVPLFFRLTIDSATEFLFGHSVQSQRQVWAQDPSFPWHNLGSHFDNGTKHLGDRARLVEFYWLHNPRDFRDSIKEVHRFADTCVQQQLNRSMSGSRGQTNDKATKPRYIFLDELIKVTRDPVELRSQLLNILLAGRDTTASLLSWTFWLLARNPNIYHKLRCQIVESFGPYSQTDRISFTALKSCIYLQHVMSEVLRLYPPVPLNARRAIRDTTLPMGGGPDGKAPIFVKKGQEVGYYICVTQRMKEFWGPDADQFNPDRWIDLRPGWEYLPSNAGPRICLGQQFALTEAGYVITRLLQRYDEVETDDGNHVPFHRPGVTDAPRNCFMRFHEAE